MDQKENKRSSSLQITVIAILAILAIVLAIFLINNSGKYKALQAEKEAQRMAFQSELDSLLVEHENVKTEYRTLTAVLKEKDSVIQENALEIKRLLDTQWEYVMVQRKLDRLREISQGYLHQMDSLYNLNRELQAENKKVKETLERERTLTQELKKEKETLTGKVEEAAILRAYNVKATPLSIKGAGGRESVTDRARRVDRIRVCFTLAENTVAPAGAHSLYVRIARPDNMILVAGLGDDYSWIFNDNILQFSISRQVDYYNDEVQVCGDWINRNAQESMLTGLYIVSVFTESHEIGQTTFVLR